MAKEHKQNNRTSKNEALAALDDIHEKYKKLPSTDIEKFAPVYYPIAIVEMNLDEVSCEDFESVQYTILKMFSLGVTDYVVLAETLGLSPNYVFKIIRLLNGYGHLDGNGITELGRDSISQGQKIVKSQVWQKFQLDALNGTLLKVDQTVIENMLNDREQTNITIGHLDYLDGMPVQAISTQLAKNNLSKYVHQKSGIINTNVTKINDIRCTEVKYARCYLMKVRNCDEPIVFAKRYNSSKEDVKERFSWQPFSVKNAVILEKYGFETDIPFSSDVARRYIGQLYSMLIERGKKVNLVEEIQYAMRKVYRFEETGVEIARTGGVVVPTVNIDEQAFRIYRSWIINFLIGIQNDGEYLITNEKLYGHVISLRTESLKLLDLAELISKKIDKYGKSNVLKRIRDKYKDYEGDNLIDAIEKEVRSI